MICPECAENRTKVINSRPVGDGGITRRRHQCSACGAQFTTLEIVVADQLSHRAFQSDENGVGWSALISACLHRITTTTLLREVEKRFERLSGGDISK